RTTDDSRAIAEQVSDKVRVIEGAWEVQGPRRNTGLAACQSDWILEIDADERVTPALATEIRETINRLGPRKDGFVVIPFDNYIGARRVRHGWGGSFGVGARRTLFPRGAKEWGHQRVHPSIKIEGEELARLEHRIDHFVDDSVADMLDRLNRYTESRAADMRDRGDRGRLLADVRRLFTRFFKCYVSRSGWREGGWGVLIALCAGLFPLLSTLKARLEPIVPLDQDTR
ncbi:MAG: glycosyltransferase family 2 protein, partial [Pseudomonadota bacterium]